MKTAIEVFTDAKNLLEKWGDGGCQGNDFRKNKYNTGFGGSRTNESVSAAEWLLLQPMWTKLSLTHAKLYMRPAANGTQEKAILAFRCAASLGLVDQNGWDLLGEFFDNKFGFNYHILVMKE